MIDFWLRFNCREKWKEKLLEGVPEGFEVQEIAERIERFGKALARMSRLQIPLVRVLPELMENTSDAEDDTGEPILAVLFNRIANAGAPLSSSDYAFSLIKHRFPEAHNLVMGLHEEESVANLLSPNDLVMTAVRLAANTARHLGLAQLPDIPVPSPKEFSRMIRPKIGSEHQDFIGKMLLPLIRKEDPCSLHQAFKQLHDLLLFDGHHNSNGLPRLAFPILQRQLVQVLLFWIHCRQRKAHLGAEPPTSFETSRSEILRFTLFWMLCANDNQKMRETVGKIAFEMLRESPFDVFPGKQLYDLLCEKNAVVRLQHPKALDPVTGNTGARTKIRGWNARFTQVDANGNRIGIHPMYQRWFFSTPMLLWIQRNTLAETFRNANPLADRESETPYDYDHICPQADWGSDYRSTDAPLKFFCEDNQAWILGECIGNYRVWDSSLNRADGNLSPASKLRLDQENSPEYFKILADSSIDPTEACGWAACSLEADKQGTWDQSRAYAFESIVEARAFRLYEQYFNDLGFGNWVPEPD